MKIVKSNPAPTAARLSLHIGELVLHGFAALNRHAIGDAVQVRLATLLRDSDGTMEHLGASAQPTAPTIRISADATAQSIGAAIAHALCDALVKGGRWPTTNERAMGRTNRAPLADETTATMKTQDV